ncbi:autotransporter-associated beta strand repeat-containing protein, partial [Undibacterium sp. CCC1.1]
DGANTYSGTTTINAGTLQVGAGSTAGTLGTGNVINNSSLAFNRSNSLNVANQISGTGNLLQNGIGTAILDGANTYSGTTTISAGTLQVGAGSTAGTLGTGTVINNSSLAFNRSDSLNVANQISGTGNLLQSGIGTAILTAANTYSGITTISAGTLQVGAGSTAGTLGTGNVVNNSSLAFNRSDSLSVANQISGSGGVLQDGSGTTILSNTSPNTYSGPTTISAGTLQVGAGGTSGSLGTGAVTNNAALVLNRSDSASYANDIGGSGSLTQAGSGTSILSATNSYTGLTTVNAGTLQIGAGASSGSLGSGSVTNNASLAFNRSDTATVANAISGSGAVLQNGSGVTVLSAANTYSGATLLNQGTLRADIINAFGTNSALSANAGTTLDLAAYNQNIGSLAGSGNVSNSGASSALLNTGNNNASSTFAGTISDGSGGVALTKSGSGTQTLSGSNTYSGNTTIAAGTLAAGALNSLSSSSALSTVAGATLNVGGYNQSIAALSGSGGIVTNGGLTAAVLTTGTNNASSTYAGTIQNGSGALGLTKVGSGTQTLTAANSYSGVTSINAGTLQIGTGSSSGSLGSGAVINNASLIFNRSDSITLNNNISGTGSLTQNGSGTLILAAANSYTGATTLSRGVLSAAISNAFASSSGLTTNTAGSFDLAGFNQAIASLNGSGGTVTNSSSTAAVLSTGSANGTDNFAGVISDGVGQVSLSKLGSGTQTLSGSNTYSGSTAISAGTLAAAATNTLSSNSALNIASGAILDLGGFNQSVAALAGSGGSVTNNGLVAAVLTSGANNAASNFAGILQDGTASLALTKTGTGTLTLSGSSTYSGTTTITAGTLAAATNNAWSSNSAVSTVAGATLDLGGFNQTIASLVGSGGSVTNSGATGAALTMGGDNSSGTFAGILQDGSATTGLTKAGRGSLTLSGNNTYSGATTLNHGSLIAGVVNALGNNSALQTASGTTLDLGGYHQTLGSLSGTGGTVTNSGAASVVLTSGGNNTASQFAGDITDGTGTIALTKVGSATLSLSGTNTYSGATTISGGTLAAAAVNAFSNNSVVSTAAGATLDLGGFNQTIAALSGSAGTVTNSGASAAVLNTGGNNSSGSFAGTIKDGAASLALLKTGSGTLSLSAANTYSGGTTIQDGTLNLDFSAVGAPASNILAAGSALTLQNGTLVVTGRAGQNNGVIQSLSGTVNNSGSDAGTLKFIQNGALDIDLNLGALNPSSSTNFVGATGVTVGARFITSSSAGANNAQTQLGGGSLWNGVTFASIQSFGGINYVVALQAPVQTVYSDPAVGQVAIPNLAAGNALVSLVNGGTSQGPNYLTSSTTTIQSLLMLQSTAPTIVAMNHNSPSDTLVLGSNTSNSATGTIALANGAQALTVGQSPNQGVLTAGIAGPSTLNLSNASHTSVLSINSIISDNAAGGPVSLNVANSAAGTTVLAGNNNYTGTTRIGSGTLQVGAGGSSGSLGSGAVITDATLALNRSDAITLANAISGSGGLSQIGSGTTTLSGSNSYSGATAISAGTLRGGAANVLGSNSALSTVAGASLDVGGYDQAIGSLAGSAGTVTNSATAAATLSIGSDNSSTSFAGTIQDGTAAVALSKTGSGTLTLSATNTYSGATTISSGTISACALNAIGSNSALTTSSGTSLDLCGYKQTIASLAGSGGTVTNSGSNAALLITGSNNSNTSFSGVLSDGNSAVGLTKTGSGIQTLAGNSSYSGATTIISGSLAAAALNALSSNSAVTTQAGATLDVGGYDQTIASLSGSGGSVTNNGTTAANLTSGGDNHSSSFAGSIQDGTAALALTKTGSGKLTLSGTNTYSGATTIAAGSLVGAASNALSSNSHVSTAAGGTLDLGGFNQAIAALSGSAGTVTNSGASAAVLSLGGNQSSGSFAGIMQDGAASLALLKTGSGMQTLSAANNYSGGTTIQAGTLNLDFSAAGAPLTNILAAGSALILQDGTLLVTGRAGQNNGVIQTLSSTTNSIGAGTLKFNQNGALDIDLNLGALATNSTTNFVGATGATIGARFITSSSAGANDAQTQIGGGSLWNGVNFASIQNVAGINYVVALQTAAQNVYSDPAAGPVAIPNIPAGNAVVQLVNGGSASGQNYLASSTTTIQSLLMSQSTAPTVLAMNHNSPNDSLVIGSNTSNSTTGTIALANGAQALTIGQSPNQGVLTAGIAGPSTLNLSNASPTAVLSINSIISDNAAGGPVSLNVANTAAGTTVLAGNSSYTGTTTIGTGTLQVGAGGNSGSLGSGAVSDSGTLALNRSDALSLANAISGSGGVSQIGSGTTTLSGSNSYTGATSVSAGTLAAGAVNAFGSNSALSTAAGATVDLGGYNQTVGSLAGSGGSVTNSGSSPATLSSGGDNSSTIFAGTIQDGTAAVALSKTGSGTLTLTGTNTYSGATTVSSGTLAAGAVNAFGSNSAVSTAAGANLDLAGYNQSIGSLVGSGGNISNSGTAAALLTTGGNNATSNFAGTIADGVGIVAFSKTGSGTQTLSGSNTYTGTTTISAGTLAAGAVNAFGSNSAVSTGAGASLDLGGYNQAIGSLTGSGGSVTNSGSSPATLSSGGDNSSTAFAGTIQDGTAAVALSKTGSGTLTLAGTNTYSGATNVTAGTLSAGAAQALSPNSAVSIAGTASLDLGGFNQTIASLAGTGGNVTNSGLTAAVLSAGADNSSTSFAGSLIDGLGTVGLSKAGSGTLSLSGSNTYSGATTLTAGTLSATAANALSPHSAITLTSTSTLDLGGYNQLIGSLAGTGSVTNNGATAAQLSSGGDNSSSNFSGILSDGSAALGLAKVGSGTLTLSGANTYSGATTVSGGTLKACASNALGNNSALSTVAGASVDLCGFNQNVGSLAGSAGSITNTAAAAAELKLGNDNSSTSFAGSIADGAGTVAINKIGSGTTTLSGSNSYSGSTTINAGTLLAGAANTLSPASAYTVAAKAKLDLAGFNQTVASLSNSGTVSLLGSVAGTTLTVNGAYTGNGGTLQLGSNLSAAGVSDMLVLNGPTASASGKTTVQIVNLGGLGGLTSGNGIKVIAAQNGATTTAQTSKDAFALAGSTAVPLSVPGTMRASSAAVLAAVTTPHVDAGAYQYRLYAGDLSGAGQDWYLRSQLTAPAPSNPLAPSDPVTAPVTTYRIEVPLFAALAAQTRQADLSMLGNRSHRNGDDNQHTQSIDPLDAQARHAWGRLLSTQINSAQDGAVQQSSTGRLNGFQAGTDVYADKQLRGGVYVGKLDGNASVSGFAGGTTGLVGNTDIRSEYKGAYLTYTNTAAHYYLDAVLQSGTHHYSITPIGSMASNAKGSTLSTSLEAGWTLPISAGMTLEPQLQLIHQDVRFDDAAISGATVEQHNAAGWVTRAGLRLKGQTSTAIGVLQPDVSVNVYRANSGNSITRFVNLPSSTDIASSSGYTALELSAGFNLALNQQFSVYGHVDRLERTGQGHAGSTAASIGVLWHW